MIRIVRTIVPDMRDYPLLLCDEKLAPALCASFKVVSSCARLPLLHCGFKGCNWQDDRTPHNHWDQELLHYQTS
eukprot:8048754-Karenia_brevis.AAC.1